LLIYRSFPKLAVLIQETRNESSLKAIKCVSSKILANILSVPEPFVVELDKHPHGPDLQEFLGQITGRRTVPNVLVNGISIGGGDDMRALEGSGAVASTLLGMLPGKITVDGKRIA
jgi:glutaredoxin